MPANMVKVESEEFDGLCSHPSPLSVLDVYNMTSLGHGLESNVEMVATESNIESSIKEESSVEMIGDSSEEVRAFRIYGKSERYHHQLVKSCLVLINSLKLGMVLGSFSVCDNIEPISSPMDGVMDLPGIELETLAFVRKLSVLLTSNKLSCVLII
ncbi:hypothetical protein NC653_005898 [Populus alba x Populus x berolinensis]|uniref:Uncharacterized protein n=1 Tax=Populus alba x Populus x berolinensis TaxID=444605 RepID=A0AAD6WBH7_9ROSI|nr:hypothetical protein NC653_005898 [Populus alba x Populus x berolinensis]